MGEVYRARDTRLDREVAIKVLPTSLSSDGSLKQRLQREAKAISKLSHPHICTLHDIGHQDGVDFLVMEYLEGETLEQRLSKGPLPPEQTIRIAAQMAGALAKAHKLGIVHRDLLLMADPPALGRLITNDAAIVAAPRHTEARSCCIPLGLWT
jgi:serine/threonine protein kinase